MIRSATEADAAAIASIYNHYVSQTIITFEESVVSGQDIAQRIAETDAQSLPWLVAENNAGAVIGYAYASKWKGRSAYCHSVESTVYLDQSAIGNGWGTKLYQALFAALSQRAVHVVIAGIALPNSASVALHQKLGMKKVAHFEQVGRKFGNWIDVGYWQLTLPMRSSTLQ